ncbi:TonB-dependent receptor [Prolixibacter denitrificans]|nr:TonB-dependent receptor [Prolixibacter denitrificans]
MIKKIFLISIIVLLLPFIVTAAPADAAKTSFTGKVTDAKTGESLPGVSIYFPDLMTGTVTDMNGNFKVDNLPASKVMVQVRFIGYKLIAENIDLSEVHEKNFAMNPSVTEINEVVVTGLSKAATQNRTPTPIEIVPKTKLLQNASSNIIDALAKEPGISQVTTGAGISKPVIRGLGFNRVVVVNDGIRQEGQQWGGEHGIEIDQYDVKRAEILKGPASLAYGSDAMAGVINLISEPQIPEDHLQGGVLTNYQTNNGLLGYSLHLGANQNGLLWNLRYSNKRAHDYKNKYDGYVYDSRFKEDALNGVIGLNKSWGYSHLILSYYHMVPGIVEGERDSLTGKFLKPVMVNGQPDETLATHSDFMSYKQGMPYQQIHHYKAILKNNFVTGKGNLKTIFGFQQNNRQEYSDIANPEQYGLYLKLNTLNYDVRYLLPESNSMNISFGVNGMFQHSMNKGTEYLVPDYHLFDAGVFVMARKNIDHLDLSGGLRFDRRSEHGESLYLNNAEEAVSSTAPGATERFPSFHSDFSGVSGSLGATYQFSESFYGKLNISRGFRAPNIAELGSNGVHEGTQKYEIGNPDLKPENSWQFDLATGLNTEHVSAELDLFSNRIHNFIFSRKLNGFASQDSIMDGVPAFKYVSGDAHLYGGEVHVDIHPHPLDWLHFENSFSYVRGVQLNQPDSMKNLPLIPAPRFQSTLRADIFPKGKTLRNGYIEFGLEHDFTQNKFYSAFGTETRTPAYTLLHAGIGTDIYWNNKKRFSLWLQADNLADVAYQSHLSRLKYTGINYATGREGVYNMGRNFSFKLQIPIDSKLR